MWALVARSGNAAAWYRFVAFDLVVLTESANSILEDSRVTLISLRHGLAK